MKKIENLFDRLESMGAVLPQVEPGAAVETEEDDPEMLLRKEELARLVAAQLGMEYSGEE